MRVRLSLATLLNRAIVPALVYLACFVLLTYPLITTFSTEVWSSSPDGWQTLWNFWWVQQSLLVLHQSPFYSFLIHFPYGISLWTHTLSLFNSLSALASSPFLSPLESYNLLVLLSFVLGGLTAFWLALSVTRSYTPSLIAGYLFTFSYYHFAHAPAHLNLTALQWLPLFVLSWYWFLRKPGPKLAVGVALALFLVTLCDYYYLLYSLLAAAGMTVWWAIRTRSPFFLFIPPYRIPFLVLCAVVLITTLPLVVPLAIAVLRDPVVGHVADQYSLDLTALVVPGRNWRFGNLTRSLWVPLGRNYAETNLDVGVIALFSAGYAVWNWRKFQGFHVRLWAVLGLGFGVLALGPALRFAGQTVSPPILPYALFEALPWFSLSGVPARMVVMVSLCVAILSALALMRLLQGSPFHKAIAVLAFALLVFELFPRPFPSRPLVVPAYVTALKTLPGDAGVLDWAALDPKEHWDKGIPPGEMMWYQTLHEKPIAFGYTARVPDSTSRQDADLLATIYDGRLDLLCTKYHLRFIALRTKQQLGPNLVGEYKIIYRDTDTLIYDLGENGACEER